MRLWSIDPVYLDSKGLVALWRETLLAKKVLEKKTKGYTKHPQLKRFENYKEPIKAINSYLYIIYLESLKRNFSFNNKKFVNYKLEEIISLNSEQLDFEFKHLQEKLLKRDKQTYFKNKKLIAKNKKIIPNKLFKIIKGPIENWEKI